MAPLVIEETAGVLPELPNVMNGILARDDLDTKALAPAIAAFEAVVTGELRDGRLSMIPTGR
jgi:hypothetical protein